MTVRFPIDALKKRTAALSVAALVLALAFPTICRAGSYSFTTHARSTFESHDMGWQRLSFPFSLTPDAVNLLPEYLYLCEAGKCELATEIVPGRGYYFYSENDVTLELEGNAPEVDGDGFYKLDFPEGWSLIGNPFAYNVEWQNVFVDDVPLMESDAVVDLPMNDTDFLFQCDERHMSASSCTVPKTIRVMNYFLTMYEQPYRLGAWSSYWIRFNRPATVSWQVFQGDATLERLETRFQTYKEGYAARHRYLGGGTTEAKFSENDVNSTIVAWDGKGDSIGFTGVALAAFIFLGEWEMARASLKYIADCENPAEPGFMYRYPDLVANPDTNLTSRDQYTMVSLGLTATMKVDGVPEDLKKEAMRLARNIIEFGIRRDWDISPGAAPNISGMVWMYQMWGEILKEEYARQIAEGDPDAPDDVPNWDFGVSWEESWERIQTGSRSSYTNANFQYYANNLNICRLVSYALLDPKKEGLRQAVSNFYLAIKGDQNTYGDILYNWVMGDSLEFAVTELNKFPEDLPNSWTPNYYTHTDYRWQRNPISIARDIENVPNNNREEQSGVDYMMAYGLLKYAIAHPLAELP